MIPSAPNGIVLRVVDTSGGLAALEAVDEVWRVPLRHFTSWDFNLPGLYPPGLFAPPGGSSTGRPGCGRTENGSIIDCDNQTLGELLPLNGTPFTLAYDSGRVPCRRNAKTTR